MDRFMYDLKDMLTSPICMTAIASLMMLIALMVFTR